jgi:hypothetical protein
MRTLRRTKDDAGHLLTPVGLLWAELRLWEWLWETMCSREGLPEDAV